MAGSAVDRTGSALRGAADAAGRMGGRAMFEAQETARKGGGLLKWLLPLLLVGLALLWLAKSFSSGGDVDLGEMAEAGTEAVADGARDAAGTVAAGAAATVDAAASAGGAVVEGVQEGVEAVGDAAVAGAAAVGEAAGEVFDAATAITEANAASQTALGALGANFSAQALVDALNLSIINFASGSSAIPAENQALLQEAARLMQRLPAGTRIEIGGHTDSTGSAATNDALSASRAAAVEDALVGYGASAEMLTSKGYGSTQPVASNQTDAGRFRNRRIGYTLVG